MKVRMTIVLDYEVSEREAFDKYRVTDVSTLASELTREAHQDLQDFERNNRGVTIVGAHAVPLYG